MLNLRMVILPLFAFSLSGCAVRINNGDFCDISRPMYFDNAETINWLAENDRWLLEGIVAHNEITATCR